MESKHAPGPWGVADVRGTIKIVTETGNPILELKLPSAEGAMHYEANARLIAAAPDLLAQLAKDAERFEFAAKRDPDQAGLWDCAAQECRAAIAKARGEQS